MGDMNEPTKDDALYALYELQRLWRTHRDAPDVFETTMDRACLVYDQLMNSVTNPIIVDRARFERLILYAGIADTLVRADPHVEDAEAWWVDEDGYKIRGRISDIFGMPPFLCPGDLDPLP